MFIFKVARYAVRTNHGGFYSHGCTQHHFDAAGELVDVREYFSRSFHCTCGEALLDGDRVIEHDVRTFTHVACVEAAA